MIVVQRTVSSGITLALMFVKVLEQRLEHGEVFEALDFDLRLDERFLCSLVLVFRKLSSFESLGFGWHGKPTIARSTQE